MRLLVLAVTACAPAALPAPALPPPVPWQINPDNARGAGAAFDVADLNHDGLLDLVFAAPSEYGAIVYGAQVWLGVGGGYFSFHEAINGPTADTRAGTAVAVCDLDGDGWSEIAVGEPEGPDCALGAAPTCPADLRRGRVAVYRYDANGLQRAPSAVLLGAAAGDQLGLRVLCPGDVDHDGYRDLVVTAPRALAQGGGEGLALLYRGGPGGVAATPAWSAGQTGPSSAEGEALAVADVDGDGWLDVLTGAPEWDGDGADEGRVALYPGGPAGLADRPSRVWLGGAAYARFGASLAIGDADGDGRPDLLVGAPGADAAPAPAAPRSRASGRAALFPGGPDGPAPEPSWSWTGGLFEEATGSVVALIDQDGDGQAEILVGSAAGYAAAPRSRMASIPVTPAGPDPTRALRYRGTQADPRVGWQVRGVGDLDGDGLPDVITGLVPTVNGQAWGLAVLPGRPAGWDGDGDGIPARDDCDDADPARGARGVEVPYDQVDQDCDGRELCAVDLDLDGHAAGPWVSADADCLDYPETATAPRDDCDDDAHDRHPGAPLRPSDDRLQSCDTTEWCFVDADGDGFPGGTATVASADADCDDPGEAPASRRVLRVSPTFSNLGRYTSGAGDVDGDGAPELLVDLAGGSRGRTAALVLGERLTASLDGAASALGPPMAGGDLDGDGFAEVAVYRRSGRTRSTSDALLVHRGGPDGPDPRPWADLGAWGSSPPGLHVAADLDGDGLGELVIGASSVITTPAGAATLHVLRGDPSGLDRSRAWVVPEITSIGGEQRLTSGDLDGDGLVDLVVYAQLANQALGRSDHALWVLRGTPDGPEPLPGWPRSYHEERYDRTAVTAGDFDGDGYGDFALIWYCGANDSCVDVFTGGPAGPSPTPTRATRLSALGLPSIHTAAGCPGDLNGDGFDDLVLSGWNLGAERTGVLFGSARALAAPLATLALESARNQVVQPAGPGPLGDRTWTVIERDGAYEAGVTDLRWLQADCDDHDAQVHPGAWDAPGDGQDADCDGHDTCWLDDDDDCVPDGDRVTPDVSGACDGPHELAADVGLREPVARLAVGLPHCPLRAPTP